MGGILAVYTGVKLMFVWPGHNAELIWIREIGEIQEKRCAFFQSGKNRGIW